MLRRVVILADDSAHWRIAGLRQLERLAREINELGAAGGKTITIFIRWSPNLPPSARFPPKPGRLSHVEFETAPPQSADLLLSSRIFLYRNSSSRLEAAAKPFPHPSQDFAQSMAAVRAAWQNPNATEGWEYLEDAAQVARCEKRFLRGSGKSQDGLVSRFINRPISRAISRLLLHTPVTPSAWTLSIFLLPFAGATFLARGGYASVVVGLLFFQLYSILDGCDGEIARAKYLESPRGRQLDTWCDVIGSLLLVVGLGYGLSRAADQQSFYFIASIFVAILIVTNELLLLSLTDKGPIPGKIDGALYPRHQRMFEGSGVFFFGERFAGWLIQLTKRDVAILAFVLLALIGQPAWILHLSGTVAAISSLLALKSRLR
jgi:phosphatidylglycerophosphate synthase